MSDADNLTGTQAFPEPVTPLAGDEDLEQEPTATPSAQREHPYRAARDDKPVRLSIDVPLEVATSLEEVVMAMKQRGHRRASKAGLVRVMIDRFLGDEDFRDEVIRDARRSL